MHFKSIATPSPTKGYAVKGENIVVPNQSMSLQEILERFTRGEPLEIGKDFQYHESEDDLEKLSHGDLVDKQEFAEKQKRTQKEYEKQETKKAKAERERLDKLAVEKLFQEKKDAEKADDKKAK